MMNIVLKNEKEWYVISSWKNENGTFTVEGFYLAKDQKTFVRGNRIVVCNASQANQTTKKMRNMKIRKKGFRETSSEVPQLILTLIERNKGERISEEEMLAMIAEAKRERYVTFDLTVGIEDRFDKGVEYIGYVSDEDHTVLSVYDKFGQPCDCHESRFSMVELTERAREVLGKLLA